RTSHPIARDRKGGADNFAVGSQTIVVTISRRSCRPGSLGDECENPSRCSRTCGRPTIVSAGAQSCREPLPIRAPARRNCRDDAANELFSKKSQRPGSKPFLILLCSAA